ncbi:thiolase [alpha proteobacterium U9-1i]|nr:thiolase [alpha proteobacterium U9-1i]
MTGLRASTAIVGVGETKLGKTPESSCMQLCAQAAKQAADEAGLRLSDIDGVLTIDSMAEPFRMHSVVLSEYLGIQPRYSMTNSLGGATSCAMVAHGAAALHAGLCDVLLIATSDKLVTGLTKDQAVAALAENAGHPQYERPYGPVIPAMYALAANRYMHEYGATPEQLAEVAVVHRRHAGLHPNAQERAPITREDVLSSKLVASPLRVLDCSLVSDGGGAIIMTRADRARDLRQKPAYLLGAGERHLNEFVHQAPDLTTCGARDSGAQAFAMAGVAPNDIDVAMLYDCFTITVLLLLEDLGFCKRGEAGAYVESGAIGLGGALPVNTHGGLLSHGHPGRPGGVFHIVEAVRQLRGQCDKRQVTDASLAFVHGNGGILSTHSSLILGGAS